MISLHPFAHIMPGNYSFVGISCPEDREEIESTKASNGQLFTTNTTSGGTCDHCGQGIMIVVRIKGANGIFKVGSDCAKKANLPIQEVTAMTKMLSQRQSKLRKQQVEDKYQLALSWVGSNVENLKTYPHPKGFDNLTLLDYLEWYKSRAGKAKFTVTVNQQRKLIENLSAIANCL